MSTKRSDRIRRTLADGAAPAPKPTPEVSERKARLRLLRGRLDALGLGRAAEAPEATPADTAWVVEDDGRPLEDQVEGEVRPGPRGAFLYVERRIPLATQHGDRPLAESLSAGMGLRAHERGPGARRHLDPSDAVFLDTETTGLAGGTGTVAFLVGTGTVEEGDFVVRQYCMRDYPEEEALLHALAEDLGDAPIVTFNGRSFDWPLLVTRWRLHRMDPAPRTHLDLLPAARRLWAESLPSHTLGNLEEHVLGLKRENDLPGWRIPQAYFDYLRTGRAGLVAEAFRHNETDVVSMLALLGRIGAILDAPARRKGGAPRDFLGTARLLLDLGREDQARVSLSTGIDRASDEEAVVLRRNLGHLCRRAGDFDQALGHWIRLARTAPTFDMEAFEQVAKILEHRERDFEAALEWVDEALIHVVTGSRGEEELRHRRDRLERRLGRRKRLEASDPD